MVLITLLAIISFLRKKEPEIILGKYVQRGKWFYLKYLLFICILYIRKWWGGDKVRTANEIDLEKVFFFGANSEGWRFAMTRFRQCSQQGFADTVLQILVPGGELFRNPSRERIVNCELKEDSGDKWTIKYRGDLLSGRRVVQNCKFEGHFVRQCELVNFQTDISIKVAAGRIAMEQWSLRFFRDLRNDKSSHTERMGRIRGKLIIDGEAHHIDVDGCFGQKYSLAHDRNPNPIHRYASFVFFLENGNRFSLNHICQPGTGSNSKMGYIAYPSGKFAPIDSSDFELFQHGENGIPPKECAFQIEADGQFFTIQVQVEDEEEHFLGKKKHRIVTRFITVKVNGVRGQGVSEFYYTSQPRRSRAVDASSR